MAALKPETQKTQEIEETPLQKQPKSLKVKQAFLHQSILIPGIGGDKTLHDGRLPGIKMQWTSLGLLIEIKNTKAIVPAANVVIAILE